MAGGLPSLFGKNPDRLPRMGGEILEMRFSKVAAKQSNRRLPREMY
jgi:hypothetical protein